jgi:hypothetical protein
MARQAMRRLVLACFGSGALLVGLAGLAAASPGITVSVAPQATLTSRVVVSVPVRVVCDSLGLSDNIGDYLSVTVQQASGRSLSTGTGAVGSVNPFPGAPSLFTCDGSTQNAVTVPVVPSAGSGPFHGGPAVITTLYARHSEGSGCTTFPGGGGFCSQTANDFFALPAPVSIQISGKG